MDLRLYFRVLWRFRLVVGAGVILGVVLALLSYTRISISHGHPSISYRESNTWQASATVFVTQPGFPEGRTVLPFRTTQTDAGPTLVPSDYADPVRFSTLAAYYEHLANGDAVQRLIAKSGPPVNGTVEAVAMVDATAHRTILPFLSMNGFAADPKTAVALANRGVAAFKTYMKIQQDRNAVPQSQRVSLQTIHRAQGAVLAAGRRKTTPVVILLTVILAAIGLAFILENLRPTIHMVGSGAGETPPAERRRSA